MARTAEPPRSVADLAADPDWQVSMSSTGRWVTAEATVYQNGREWRIGLTPGPQEVTALILWADGKVVDHARGAEATICALASQWRANLVAHRPWHETGQTG